LIFRLNDNEKVKVILRNNIAASLGGFPLVVFRLLLPLSYTVAYASHSYSNKVATVAMFSSAWLACFKRLHHPLNHHLNEEEHEVFRVAGKALTQKQKKALGDRYPQAILEK
jgi:hypothetical protein